MAYFLLGHAVYRTVAAAFTITFDIAHICNNTHPHLDIFALDPRFRARGGSADLSLRPSDPPSSIARLITNSRSLSKCLRARRRYANERIYLAVSVQAQNN